MEALEEIAGYLPQRAGRALLEAGKRNRVENVRLRAGGAITAEWHGGAEVLAQRVEPVELRGIVAGMLKFSPYAWEDELGQGYFTLPGGCRAGVAGRFHAEGGCARLAEIASLCIRVARACPGCAAGVVRRLTADGYPRGGIILSPPGGGKTTVLRDAVRELSLRGFTVGLADERDELAAVREGVPGLDVGPRTDVVRGLSKAEAFSRLLRAMAPEVLAADEIGAPEDAGAIENAARAGVAVITTAHAGTLTEALARQSVAEVLNGGALTYAFLLGGAPGTVRAVYRREAQTGEWKPETTERADA